MKVVGGIAAVVLLGVLAWLAGTFYVASNQKSAADLRSTQEAQIAAMGEKAAGELRALVGPSLAEACAGKVPTGKPESFVTYSLKLPELERPALSGSMKRVDAIITRMNSRNEYLQGTGLDPPRPPGGLPLAYSMSPDDWARLLRDADEEKRQTEAVRVVLFTVFSSLRAPSVNFARDGFSPGSGDYRTRVVAFPSGQVLCEGTGAAHLKLTKVTGHGGSSGDAQADSERELSDYWVRATVSSPLDDVCTAGGTALCDATRLEISPPDW